MKKKILAAMLITACVLGMAGCQNSASDKNSETTVTIFAAKSLNRVVDELIMLALANQQVFVSRFRSAYGQN